MPPTATSNPRIAPNINALFHTTGFFAGGGCGGGVTPLGGLIGGGPTGGVGGMACGPVEGNALVGRLGGGAN